MDEEISFRRITRIYREESSKRSLTPLEPDFFEKLNFYLDDLESRLKEQQETGGESKTGTLMRDEYQKACRKRDQVFRLRSRKVANLAASRAGGASVDLDPLTRPEVAMFEAIVELITSSRGRIYGTGKPEPVCEVPVKESPAPSGNIVIRVLEDIPPFAGVEGNYDLKKEDVASLPRKVAEILVKQGKAQEIQIE
jgi:DNA replication initiation complex subunit (GINS family)